MPLVWVLVLKHGWLIFVGVDVDFGVGVVVGGVAVAVGLASPLVWVKVLK